MKSTVLIGVILLLLGVIALGYQGITYVTRETIVDAGPVRVTAEKERTIPLPPLLGGAALIAGLALVFMGTRNST